MVDVPVSHMTLLIVTIVFTVVNLCLIIATGGIIYNWQDRFMGPVLKCEQPKWNSDGRTQPNKIAMPWNTWNTNTNYLTTNWNNWNNGNAWTSSWTAPIVATSWSAPIVSTWTAPIVSTWTAPVVATSWTAWAAPAWTGTTWTGTAWTAPVQTYGNNYNPTNNYDGSIRADMFQMGNGAQWSSWKGNAWSTCPVLQFTRWSTWTQPRQQQWTQWTQTTWGTWTQPSAWVGTGNDQAAWMAWAQTQGAAWTNQANIAGQAWASNVWTNW